MMPDEVATCLCGIKQWDAGGASLSPGLCSQWFTCARCHRPALFLSNGGGVAFITPTQVSSELSQEGVDWINKTLLVQWRDTEMRLTEARERIEKAPRDTLCDELMLPRGTKIGEMNEEQQERMRAMLRTLREENAWVTPPGFEEQALPPQIPASLTLFHPCGNGDWKRIKNSDTISIEVPADPIRVQHDTFFEDVFGILECTRGKIPRIEIRNEYCGAENEPWYQFCIGDATFKVGPRKRVYTIIIDAPKGIETRAIRNVAKSDNTTYQTEHGWQSDAVIAREIEVHAWTKEKLIEYLTILMRTCDKPRATGT